MQIKVFIVYLQHEIKRYGDKESLKFTDLYSFIKTEGRGLGQFFYKQIKETLIDCLIC